VAGNFCGIRMTTSAWGGSGSSMTRLKRGRFEVDSEQTKKLGTGRGLLNISRQVGVVVSTSCPSARAQTEHLSDSDDLVWVGEGANRQLMLQVGIDCSHTTIFSSPGAPASVRDGDGRPLSDEEAGTVVVLVAYFTVRYGDVE
jgi:hypothetical protein